ncbi:DedA family protein [Criblamydia sequanensis]|uniref:Conserved putative membrane protein n=1 Tax=Candidatus Criblamydia sequanensis CRIB-18 TaxID=1437425 RepID=A0A090D0F5_9BACT|nr:DedA family protein [Criblamydia sequanensis]CDR34756.1 Conserved putative membrane protein [Criblamydia sequanensis CRIB-18]
MFNELISNLSFWLPYIPYIFFALLLLAGINIPISEDIILLTGGMIANRYMPEQTYWLYGWLFAGCLISGWEAYGIGRYFGPKLFDYRFSKHIVTPLRVESLGRLFHRFGIFTFLIGRFIPGGVRNALFMSSGLCRMPFSLFLIRDGVACLLSTSVTFSLGYIFAGNYEAIISFFKTYNNIVILTILFLIIAFVLYRFIKKKNHQISK